MTVRVALPRRLTAVAAALVLVVTSATAASVVLAPAASAGTGPGPIMQDGSNHVTADALPTAQIDGVVWSQAIAGNTVYAGGQFTHARPAGAAPGVNTVPRTNAMAYTLSTGVMTSWAPTLDGTVRAVAVSPDHSRVYLAGQFTKVNGATHQRIVAFNTSDGSLVSAFTAQLDATAYAIAATNTTVYVGGAFTNANGQSRSRLAAFSASTGALLGWAPTADQTVEAMVLTPDGTEVIVGGHIQSSIRSRCVGLAAVKSTDGTKVAWATGNIVRDSGPDSAITSLSTDGTAIYGTGYKFQGNIGNLEGAFSASPDSGALNWVEDCHGDSYDAFSTGSVVYTVSHSHFCGNDGSFPETTPTRTYHHALSWTANATGTLAAQPDRQVLRLERDGCSVAIQLVPRYDGRHLHRPEPGRVVGHGQQPVRRPGWRVPDGQPDGTAGPGALRGAQPRAEPATSALHRRDLHPPLPTDVDYVTPCRVERQLGPRRHDADLQADPQRRVHDPDLHEGR